MKGSAGRRKADKVTQPPVLTVAQTATLFGTTEKVIRKAIKAGELEVFRLGRTTYVLREPLEHA